MLLLYPLDASGKIRIWDTTQKEHMLKYEYTPISGKVKDIAWTEDSKRLAVVGDGREKWVSGFFFIFFLFFSFLLALHWLQIDS